jgi:hypothetical protein
VPDGRRGEDVLARDDPPEVRVARDLQAHAAGAVGVVEHGEHRRAVRRGIAREHPLREAAAAQQVGAPAVAAGGGERLLGSEHDSGRGRAGAREELPSGVHQTQTTPSTGGRCGRLRAGLDLAVSHY